MNTYLWTAKILVRVDYMTERTILAKDAIEAINETLELLPCPEAEIIFLERGVKVDNIQEIIPNESTQATE